MKTLAILQARMKSSRLPGKVMLPLNGSPMINWQIRRLQKSHAIEKLIVATSIDSSDDELVFNLERLPVNVYRGSLNNVYQRFLEIIKKNSDCDPIIRLTGDCPLVMPDLIDEMVTFFKSDNFDYVSNCLEPTFPDGLDIEIFTRESFLKLSLHELSVEQLEHVTLKYRDRDLGFKIGEFKNPVNLGQERWTVDYPEDFNFIQRVFNFFRGKETTFTLEDVLTFQEKNPMNRNLVSHTFRNIALKKENISE